MKKIISIIAALCVITIADAQNYDNTTIKSVRGGLTLSQLTVSGVHTQMGCGFSIDYNFQQTLSDTYPIYLETGIGLNLKKFGQMLLFSDPDESFYKPRCMFLGIPLMINYKLFMDNDVVIYPSVGLALQVGLSEKYEDYKYDDDYNKEYYIVSNDIIEDGVSIIDIPLRLGITAEFKQKYIINYTYESGMLFNDTTEPMNGFINSNYITLGIRF